MAGMTGSPSPGVALPVVEGRKKRLASFDSPTGTRFAQLSDECKKGNAGQLADRALLHQLLEKRHTFIL